MGAGVPVGGLPARFLRGERLSAADLNSLLRRLRSQFFAGPSAPIPRPESSVGAAGPWVAEIVSLEPIGQYVVRELIIENDGSKVRDDPVTFRQRPISQAGDGVPNSGRQVTATNLLEFVCGENTLQPLTKVVVHSVLDEAGVARYFFSSGPAFAAVPMEMP